MNARLRDFFDGELDVVLAGLPQRVHDLLDEVPMHVEDYPSSEILESMGVGRDELCGLYSGVPLGDRSVWHAARLPDVVTIYREGILHASSGADGHLSQRELRRQIRITVLHELGHHHGLDEEELAELGYG